MAVKKKIPRAPSLVPPPPPTALSLLSPALAMPGQNYATMGSLAPEPGAQPGMGVMPAYTPAQLPEQATAPQLADYMPSDQTTTAFGDLIKELQTQHDAAKAAAASPSGMLPDVLKMGDKGLESTIPQSDFESKLMDAAKSQIIKNMSGGGETAGSRFRSGMNMGQELAASIAIPLLGMFGGPGSAQGAMQTAQQLNQHVQLERANQRADKHAKNQMTLQLAQLYDGMDPKSAKNILNLLTKQAAVSSANRQNAHQAQAYANQTTNSLLQANKDKATLEQGGKEKYNAAGNQHSNYLLQRAKAEDEQNFRKVQAGNMTHDNNLADHNLLVAQDNALTSKQRMRDQESNQAATSDLGQQKLQLDAAKQLEQTFRMNAQAMSAQSGGQAKYKDYATFLKNNPAMMKIVGAQMKAAGIDGDPAQVFESFLGTGAPTPGNNEPWYAPFTQGLAKVFGGGQQAAQVPTLIGKHGLVYKDGKWQ